MVISGLASLLGLGGIADKIKKILETIQKPVGKVVDGIIGGVVKYGKKLLGKLKRKKKSGPKDHGALAKEASAAVKQKAHEMKEPDQLKAFAKSLEPQYAARLEPGVKLRFDWKEPAASDRSHVGYSVVVAPNDFTLPDVAEMDAVMGNLRAQVGPIRSWRQQSSGHG